MGTPGTALIRSFERHLRAANRAPRTIGNHLETLLQAEAYLSSHGSGLERATRRDLEAYLAHLLTTGRSGSTAATRYKWLRAFYRWLEDEEEIPSPMARMTAPMVSERPVPVLGADALRPYRHDASRSSTRAGSGEGAAGPLGGTAPRRGRGSSRRGGRPDRRSCAVTK